MLSGNALIITATALVGLSLAPYAGWSTVPFSLMYVGLIITTYPASLMMQRVGRKPGFTLGALLGIIGAAVSAWAVGNHDFAAFCLGSVLLGAFNAFGQHYRFAAAEVADGALRSRAISYVIAGGVLAAFIGPNLAKLTRGVAAAEFAGGYASVAVLYCFTFLLVQLMRLPLPAAPDVEHPRVSLAEVARSPLFGVAVISGMVGYGVMNMLMTATPLAMAERGLHFDYTASVIQWHVVSMFAPAFFTGHLISKIGATRVMAAGTLGLAGCCLVNLMGTDYWHFLSALIMLGIGWNFCFIGATSLLAERTAARGKTQGLNDFLVFTVVGMTAVMSGQLHHRLGWEAINLYTIPVILVVMAVLLAAAVRERRGAGDG